MRLSQSTHLLMYLFVFGDIIIHPKDWLTYSGGTDGPDELCYNFFYLIWLYWDAGPILEDKGMCVIFQRKGKKGQNILKFEQKCTKFENILKKGRWLHVIIACNKLLEKALKWFTFPLRLWLFDVFILSGPSICSAVVFPPIKNSDYVFLTAIWLPHCQL